MAQQLAGNWVSEFATTLGTGNLVLNGSSPGEVVFSDAISAGEVYYSIQEGDNREAGIGNFNGGNIIVRTTPQATLFEGVFDDNSPSPIALSGQAKVSATLNAENYLVLLNHVNTNGNPHNTVAQDISYDPVDDPVTSNTLVQTAMVDHAQAIEERVPSANGIVAGGFITESSLTQFDVSAGNGVVFDNTTDPFNTTVTPVTWLAQNNITITTNGKSAGVIRIFITQAGVVLQVEGEITLNLFREYIFLGAVFFADNAITSVINAPSVIKQTATDSYDMMVSNIILDGGDIEPVTNLLQIFVNATTMFYPGVNWYNDRKNPNAITYSANGNSSTPAPFKTMTQTGLLGAEVTTIPTSFNPTADTISALPGNDATIHRLYMLGIDPQSQLVLLYGQNQYTDARNAKDNLQVDDSLTVLPEEVGAMFFLGYICVEGNAPDFNDINDAWIVNNTEGGSSNSSIAIDHTVLTNRDALNQHPQLAITDLVTDLAAKAPLLSPSLTGTPTAPTASVGTKNTQIATTAFVKAEPLAPNSVGTAQLVDGAVTDAKMANQKVNRSGDAMSGQLIVSESTGGGAIYTDSQLVLEDPNEGVVGIGFHRVGFTACQLRHQGDGLILSGTSQTNAADLLVNGSVFSLASQDISPTALTRKDYVDGVSSKTSDGYTILPNGIIIQWGTGNANSTTNFPIAFPTQVFSVVPSFEVADTTNTIMFSCHVSSKTNSQFTVQGRFTQNLGLVDSSSSPFMWVAIGI